MRAATSVRASARTGARAPRRASARMMGMAGREVGTREGGRPQHWLPGEWPDPELVDYCGANFPDDGIATVEQGYTLMMDYDYTVLDVRCDPELNVTPVIRTGVNVPIIFGKKKFENGQVTYDQEANANFIEDVKAAGFTQDSKILVCCSDGRQRSIMALMALDDAGFTNIVGLKGGANFFARIFDNKLVRRLGMEAKEVYTHSGDGCGIHGSGAAFKKVDSVLMDLGSVKDSITWIDWEEAVGGAGGYSAPAPAPAQDYAAPAPAQDYDYGSSAPAQDYDYGSSAPAQDYDYGSSAPAQDYDYGYGASAPAQESYDYGSSAPAQESYDYGSSAPASSPTTVNDPSGGYSW